LHLLAGRLQGAKRAAAERGELRCPLPIGYVYDDEGRVLIDPDEEVATAISDVFTAFTATGSAYQVVAAFADRRFPRRAYGGAWAGRVRFGRLSLPGARHSGQPGLRRGVRVRPATHPSGGGAGRVGALIDHRTAP
jgi:hypothetical protein